MKKLLVGTALTVVVAQSAHAQTIVYDNTTFSLDNNLPLLPEWMDESAEAGDEVLLGGTDRQVTQLNLLFNYRGTAPGTVDALIRFRYYDEDFQGPGAILYESSLTRVTTIGGMNNFAFDVPNIIVPDHFVWTIQLFNRQGSVGELGPAYFNPGTIGFSDDFLWQRGGNEWTAYSWGGDPYANFGARITAVPEPSTLCIIGAALLATKVRRRAKPAQS